MEDTIQQNRQIIFRYFDLNENDEKVYRQDGHQYVVESVALVFNEDNCHLVVYSGRHDSTANYRVDRMDGVEIIGEGVTEVAKLMRDSIADMIESTFKMYGSAPVKVALEFDDKLIGVVYDKFSEDTTLRRTGERAVMAVVTIFSRLRLTKHHYPTVKSRYSSWHCTIRLCSCATTNCRLLLTHRLPELIPSIAVTFRNTFSAV